MEKLNRKDIPHGDFSGQLGKMVTEGWTARVTTGIEAAISASFKTDQVIRSVMTQSEIRRRFKICVEGFCIMRRDLKWAVPRIVDELPVYLRSNLDGMNWEPDEDRNAWLSGDSKPMDLAGDDMTASLLDESDEFEVTDLDQEDGSDG